MGQKRVGARTSRLSPRTRRRHEQDGSSRRLVPVGDALDRFIDAIVVDAYSDCEQIEAFRQAFEDGARFPFRAQVVGARVDVIKVDFNGDERHGLVAICSRDQRRYAVSLLDLEPASPLALETSRLLNAYRRWAGAGPIALSAGSSAAGSWMYRRCTSLDIDVGSPLVLMPRGVWDPADEYWEQFGVPIDGLSREIIDHGPRPCFEMEEVLPGVELDD